MKRHAIMIVLVGLMLGGDEHGSDAAKKEREKLNPPEGQVVLFKVRAKGVQIYQCNAKGEWVFKAPEAELLDDKEQNIGKHYKGEAGPTWEAAADGSRVVGKVEKQAPAPKPDCIPWLLLKANAHLGEGRFSKVTYIKRMDTEGGMMPTEKLTLADVGKEVRVPYKATYIFYREEEKPKKAKSG